MQCKRQKPLSSLDAYLKQANRHSTELHLSFPIPLPHYLRSGHDRLTTPAPSFLPSSNSCLPHVPRLPFLRPTSRQPSTPLPDHLLGTAAGKLIQAEPNTDESPHASRLRSPPASSGHPPLSLEARSLRVLFPFVWSSCLSRP